MVVRIYLLNAGGLMIQKMVHLVGTTLLISAVFAGQVNAQPAVSPQKRALIKELLELTQAGTDVNALMLQNLDQMKAEVPKILAGLMASSGLQGEAAEKKANEISQRILKRYRERLPQVIDLKQTTEQISYSLYDKFYTETELKDIIVFYKTATGKKVIASMPKLLSESMRMSNQLVLPKVVKLMQEIMQEELNKLPTRAK